MTIQKYARGVASVLACLAAVAALPAAGKVSEDAVAFQINSAHDGSVTFAAGFPAPLTKLWSFNATGQSSYPLIADGRVYVTATGNDIFALNLLTGKKVWEHLIGGGGNLGAYDDGMLFYANSDGQVTALKAKSGKQVWGTQAWGSSPIAVDGRIYVAGGGLTAIDEKTGTVAWTQGVEATDGTAAYGDDGLYVGGPCQYYKFSAADGATIWHDDNGCEGGGGTAPVYFNKRDYFVDWAEGNFVLDSATGAVAGTFAGSVPPSFFVNAKNHPYSLQYTNGQLYCVDAKTGNVKWSFATPSLSGQPIAINGQPVIGTYDGDVIMLDGNRGKKIWSDNVGASVTNLTAGDGVLAVTTQTSVTVYAPQ